jgi:penicillin-binding protein 2
VLGFVAVLVFCALFFRLWALQVISGDRYLDEALNNQVRPFRVQAPRGSIVDRNGTVLVSNVAGTLVQLWPAALNDLPEARRTAVLRRLSVLLSVPLPEIRERLATRVDDPLTPVTIKTSVHDDKVNYLLEHQTEFPGVQIADTQLRRYELGTFASQLLGFVGEISADQLEQLEGKGYALGDRIGQTGLERVYDQYLRGAAGVGQVHVDAVGQITSDRTFSRLPEAGETIRLTIDAGLQQAAEEAIRFGIRLAHDNGEWAADGGAIVAMEPNTGEILALASNPTFDPSVYVGRVDPKKLEKLARASANHPTLNRAVAGLYPPGSTFKPVTAIAALEKGLVRPDELIQCEPERVIDGQTFVNWDPYRNEPMTMTTALANSCDTYFYELALRFYHQPDSPLQMWSRRMGFGVPTGIDVGPEGGGLIPTPEWRQRTFETEIDRLFTSGDSVQLSIGQGDVLVTPLQLTRFYALVANGGKLVQPHVVKQVEEPGNEGETPRVLRPFKPKPAQDVGISPTTLKLVREGLYDATHATWGTSASIFGAYDIPIAGKTGTAEKYVELPGFLGLRDQSWWCGYGPYEEPELVVCALIENGGHGGEAAAPAALKVFERYFGIEATNVVARGTD